MSKKQKYPEFTTPPGIAVFPHLIKADTKFDDGGVFHTKLRIPEGEWPQKIVEEAQRLIDEEFLAVLEKKPALKKQLKRAEAFPAELDKETGEETGNLLLQFRMNAQYMAKDGTIRRNSVVVFDSQGGRITTDPWSGSVIRVRFYLKPYFMESTKTVGVSLKLLAVQVIQMVRGGEGRDAASYGFGVVEDGYVAENETNTEASGGTPGSSIDDDEIPF